MHYFDNPSDETTSGSNQMQQNDQMPQIMAMLTKIFTKLEEHDLRFDALEKRVAAIESRLDVIETRLDAIENRLDVIETRLDAIEARLDALENRVAALEQRMTIMETEVSRLGVLFEDNEKKLQHILDVLTSYLKKMEKVDHLDESMIEQTQGLQITKIALANHIQNRKIHLMPPRGRPKKNPDESGM
jgi:chromosome segregation ATPase